MDRRGRGEGPAFGGFPFHDVGNVFGELLADTPLVFGFERGALGDRVGVATVAVADWEATRLVRQFFVVTPVSVGDVKRLHQLQTGPAIRRVVDPVCFYPAAIGDNDE